MEEVTNISTLGILEFLDVRDILFVTISLKDLTRG